MTTEERTEVIARLKLDRSALADEYHIKYLKHALTDWKIWVHMLITIGRSLHPCVKLPTSRFFRYLHSTLLDFPVLADHCEKHGLYQRDGPVDECSTVCYGVYRNDFWGLGS